MNLNAPLQRKQIEALAREAPKALASLALVMQGQLVALRAEVGWLHDANGRTRGAEPAAGRPIPPPRGKAQRGAQKTGTPAGASGQLPARAGAPSPPSPR